MAYGELKGAPKTFPGGANPSTPKAASKRPCKYGPRDADGYCPKAPKRASKARTRSTSTRSKPPCKYGPRDEDGYCPKKPRAGDSGPSYQPSYAPAPAKKAPAKKKTAATRRLERKIETNVERTVKKKLAENPTVQRGAVKVSSGVAAALKYLKTPVGALGSLGVAGVAGTVALAAAAGLASYAGTRYLINRRKSKKEQAQERAWLASQAFRVARLKLAEDLGRALSVMELQALKRLYDNGLTNRGW